MISYDGTYTNESAENKPSIVCAKWLESSNINESSSLLDYTCQLKDQKFYVFGKATTMYGQTEAELALWRKTAQTKIESHMGQVLDDMPQVEDEMEPVTVILPSCTKTSD